MTLPLRSTKAWRRSYQREKSLKTKMMLRFVLVTKSLFLKIKLLREGLGQIDLEEDIKVAEEIIEEVIKVEGIFIKIVVEEEFNHVLVA